MKRKAKRLIILAVILIFLSATSTAFSSGNPYPIGECTYVAWQRVYDDLGIELPIWGHAKDWNDNAASLYTVDSVPSAQSVLVEEATNSMENGHVAYIEKIEDGYAYYTDNYNPPSRFNISNWINDRTGTVIGANGRSFIHFNYTVTFDPNGGNGSSLTIKKQWDESFILTKSIIPFTRDGFRIDHWSDTPDDTGIRYYFGDDLTGINKTLFAIWIDNVSPILDGDVYAKDISYNKFTIVFKVTDNIDVSSVALKIAPDIVPENTRFISGSYNPLTQEATIKVNLDSLKFRTDLYIIEAYAWDSAENRLKISFDEPFSSYIINSNDKGIWKSNSNNTFTYSSPTASGSFNGISQVKRTLQAGEKFDMLGSMEADGTTWLRIEATNEYVKKDEFQYDTISNLWQNILNQFVYVLRGQTVYAVNSPYGYVYLNGNASTTTGEAATRPSSPSELSEIVNYIGHQYQLINKSVSWEAAKAACEKKGGYLLTINSTAEQNFINSFLSTSGEKDTSYWIGLTDKDNEGDWSSWDTGEKVTYTNWGTHEPDNYDAELGVQNYAVISTGVFYDNYLGWRVEFGQWDDISDILTMYYICEWGPLMEYSEESGELLDDIGSPALEVMYDEERSIFDAYYEWTNYEKIANPNYRINFFSIYTSSINNDVFELCEVDWDVEGRNEFSSIVLPGKYRFSVVAYDSEHPSIISSASSETIEVAGNRTYTFSASGGTGGPTAITVQGSQTIVIPEEVPTYTGYDFIGWKSENIDELYQPGDEYYGATSLYACWETSTEKHTVKALLPNGEWYIVKVEHGKSIGELIKPKKARARFTGWYTEDGNLISSTYMVMSDMTIVAHWQDLAEFRLPSAIKQIEAEAFRNINAASIVIPEEVTTIGDYAFADSANLYSVVINTRTAEFGKNVFENCAEDLTIFGYEESTAATYAVVNNIPFELIVP